MVNFLFVVGCFLLCIFYSLVCESLKYFLRSRLAYVCRLQQNEERFGIILRDDEDAQQAAEASQLLTLVLTLVVGAFSHYYNQSGTTRVSNGMLWWDLVSTAVVFWLFLRVFPWAIARVAAEHILFHSWPLINFTMKVASPFLKIANKIDTFVHRLSGRQDPTPESLETLTEEIQSVVDEGERDGILESRAGKMVHRVMELRQVDVRAVMTPRTDIATIQADVDLEKARQELLDAGHSRVPVVDGSADNIVGILYARDLLEQMRSDSPDLPLKEITRDAFYVPETSTIDGLLNRMKQQRLHLAIVLDEYGGVTGLVTLEDILEEIVGDIADEFDEDEDERIEWLDPQTIIVDARMHIDEMNDLFDLELPEDQDFDTLGGLVFSTLERVPKQGERFEWNGIQFTVLEATERKISRIQLYSSVPWPSDDDKKPVDESENEDSIPKFRLIRDSSEAEEQAG